MALSTPPIRGSKLRFLVVSMSTPRRLFDHAGKKEGNEMFPLADRVAEAIRDDRERKASARRRAAAIQCSRKARSLRSSHPHRTRP